MKWVAERRDNVDVSIWCGDSLNLPHKHLRVVNVLKNCVTFYAGESVIGERQSLAIRNYIHSGQGKEIYIDISHWITSSPPRYKFHFPNA